jgi:hypothetical protein
MDTPQEQPEDPSQSGGSGGTHEPAPPDWIERNGQRKAERGPLWSLEIFEAPLMDRGLAYTVTDAQPNNLSDDGAGWIEFRLPTKKYRNPSRARSVRIRLTVIGGRLSITAPEVYAVGSLRKTSDPPPAADGTLRLVRLGDEGDTNLDLVMAADGTTTAVLQMATLRRSFNRADIVQIAEEFAMGIDFLDIAVRKSRLMIRRPKGS